MPVVVVEGDLSALPLTAGVDQVEGARLATRHLLDLGHETVAHLAGPDEWLEAQARARGLALRPAGHGPPGARRCSARATGPRAAATRSAARWRGADETTAVFVANDQMALGLLRALARGGPAGARGRQRGRASTTCPRRSTSRPPLTTVRQDFVELGRRAMGVHPPGARRRGAGLGAAGAEPTLVVRPRADRPAAAEHATRARRALHRRADRGRSAGSGHRKFSAAVLDRPAVC